MKIIDAHLHFSQIESFKRTAEELSNIDYSTKGLQKEFQEAGITAGIAMGITEQTPGGFPDHTSPNPMGIDLEAPIPQKLLYCIGINPFKLQGENKEKELAAIDDALKQPAAAGIKIYAGYYPYYVHDKIYEPIYKLAAKHNVPVVIHSGDTYSERGLIKYSHPLHIDELAVAHRDINIVISHFGDPWIMDTAEITRKNHNVFADLSGLIVGDAKEVLRYQSEPLFTDHIKRGFIYTDKYDKLLFGTDWPLVQIKPYIQFIKHLIPEKHHEAVFYQNALNVFPKLKTIL